MLTVRVPATSANLGPGFDVFGLALKLYLTVKAKGTPNKPVISYRGRGAGSIPLDETNLIWRAYRHVLDHERAEAPNLLLEVENDIPLARGLGSSGAAVIAGVVMANEIGGLKLSHEQLLTHSLELEPHPDNITAALVGGLVACCVTDQGRSLYGKVSISPAVRAIVVIPDFELSTKKARAVLPKQVSRADAVFNLQRVALLAAGLRDPFPRVLTEAMRDKIHQPYRTALIPGLEEVLNLRDVPGLLGVSLSGAGPSVLALAVDNFQQIGQTIQLLFSRQAVQSEILICEIDGQGAVIKETGIEGSGPRNPDGGQGTEEDGSSGT